MSVSDDIGEEFELKQKNKTSKDLISLSQNPLLQFKRIHLPILNSVTEKMYTAQKQRPIVVDICSPARQDLPLQFCSSSTPLPSGVTKSYSSSTPLPSGVTKSLYSSSTPLPSGVTKSYSSSTPLPSGVTKSEQDSTIPSCLQDQPLELKTNQLTVPTKSADKQLNADAKTTSINEPHRTCINVRTSVQTIGVECSNNPESNRSLQILVNSDGAAVSNNPLGLDYGFSDSEGEET